MEYFPLDVPNIPLGSAGGSVGGSNGGGGGGGGGVGKDVWGWSIICFLYVFCLKKSCVRDRQTNGPTNPLVEIL